MARVLVLSLTFPPDNVSTAQLMGELATDLKQAGHDVRVLTSTPHYNQDLEAEARQPLRSHWGRLIARSDFHGIPVYHIFMPRKQASILLRLASWTWFHLVSSIFGAATSPRPDVIFTPSPPLTNGVNAWLVGRMGRVPFIYNVQEMYPDCLVQLGLIRNQMLLKFLYWLERFVYRKAAAISVISPSMQQALIEQKGVPGSKVNTIENWVDTSQFSPLPKDNDFSRAHAVTDRFVVSYAGNMGPHRKIDDLIAAADLLRDRSDVQFMLIGGGTAKERFAQRVRELGLSNCSVLDHQPFSLVPMIYAASDLCFVPLSVELAVAGLPSKVYKIMSSARPVLAATEADSYLAELVRKTQCGIVVPPASPEGLAEAVVKYAEDRQSLERMGAAGRSYVIANYSRQAIVRHYLRVLEEVVASPLPPSKNQPGRP
jgi:colanic acid biosynthesis glycosyl transferase WcaI